MMNQAKAEPDETMEASSDGTTNANQSNKPSRSMMRSLLMIGGFAAAGYAYYFFVGCQTGSCPLTSNAYISTAYGGLIGLLMSRS